MRKGEEGERKGTGEGGRRMKGSSDVDNKRVRRKSNRRDKKETIRRKGTGRGGRKGKRGGEWVRKREC